MLRLLIAFAIIAIVLAAQQALTENQLLNAEVDRCTSIVVGKKAGSQGPMNTHTADCADCDFRINKTPAKDWPAGSMRALYVYKGSYPATIASDRGTTWHPDNLEGSAEQLELWGKESQITGYIPQVAHTYALFEAGYGIMNEHQVAIGESTCAARFWAAPTIAGGKAMIEAREMSKIALERCKTAREAVLLMGELAVKYGFYAADWSGGDLSLGEGGEGLTVIDKHEAWVFHVLADDTGTSAVWAAKRIPEDHVAVIANQFVIRDISPDCTDCLYSANIFDVGRRSGFWDGTMPLDFLKTFAPPRAHSPYATRRVWRVFNIVAPNTKINMDTDAYGSDYPFSVKAERVLTPQDIMNINRDHYEGTPLDLTQGIAAGPYGDPNRFDMTAVDNLTFIDVLQGSYERAISLFRTSYSFVAVSRESVVDQLGVLWFSQYAPSTASYSPFYVWSLRLPEAYTRGSLFQYDPSVSFWSFCAVGNYAGRFYKFAMQDVFAAQRNLETAAAAATEAMERSVMALLSGANNNNLSSELLSKISEMVTEVTLHCGQVTVETYQKLLPTLITKYHDGYRATQLDEKQIKMVKLFYPKWWLDLTGYFKSTPNKGPDTIMFASNPMLMDAGYVSGMTMFVSIVMTAVLSLTLGVVVAKRVPDLTLSKDSSNNAYSKVKNPYDEEMWSTAGATTSTTTSSTTSTSGKKGFVQMYDIPGFTMKRDYMSIDQ